MCVIIVLFLFNTRSFAKCIHDIRRPLLFANFSGWLRFYIFFFYNVLLLIDCCHAKRTLNGGGGILKLIELRKLQDCV